MLENTQPPKDFISETAQKEILPSVDILLPELDRKLVETGLRVLAQYYLNKEHPFPHGLLFVETSAPPFQYAVTPVMEQLARARGVSIPQVYPIVLESLWNWRPQDQVWLRKLMKQNARAIIEDIQRRTNISIPQLLLIDDYAEKGYTIKAGEEAFSELAHMHTFTFLASREVVTQPPSGLIIGAEDPYADEYGNSHGFTFRRERFKKQKKIITGIEKKVFGTMSSKKIRPEEDNPMLRSTFQARLQEIGEKVAAEIH